MPRWLLNCPECDEYLLYSEVTPENERADFDPFLQTVKKPVLPPEGLELECPNCKKPSRFLRHQLKYQK